MTIEAEQRRRLGFAEAERWNTMETLGRGWLIAVRVPGIVLFASSVGYGALCRDTGLDLGLTLFINAVFFALPAQVVVVDQIARGAALTGAAFAVALTAIRLLPMTVSLLPLLRHEDRLPRLGFLATHFVAISVWLDGIMRLPLLPTALRLPYFIGTGLGMMSATLCGSATGFIVAKSVPPIIAAVLLFMPPSFFLLSLIGTARIRADWLAIGLGAILGPVFYTLAPGVDLLLTGVIGGTIAFAVSRMRR
ncbi:MAG: AzlC family ABC transporter permease [Alphaproteobacteria bacterium]|nr:AzlC family ABC transporter permease [Alphaproteobacteria bacterium]